MGQWEIEKYCTERQAEVYAIFTKMGSRQKAAQVLGINRRTVDKTIDRVHTILASKGIAPEHLMSKNAVAPGLHLERTTTLLGPKGETKLQWVRAKADDVDLVGMQNAITEAFEDYAGRSVRVRKPRIKKDYKNYLSIYPMGDPHIGMYSWAQESGADFDTEMATSQLTEAMQRLVDSSPPSKHALILNLGDFFHSDNLDNRTHRSGHALDVDTRMNKVWQLGMEALLACIDAAKEKHEHVTIRNEIGNHDDHTSLLLSIALEAWYKNDPRVTVDRSPAKFFYFKWGKCLIGTTHGDTVKFPKLAGVMAADRPEWWGQTLYRYWYTGHFHSQKVEEYPGVLLEQFRTLAAKDAWTAGAGYRAGRDMRLIIMHKDKGEIERHRVDVNELENK